MFAASVSCGKNKNSLLLFSNLRVCVPVYILCICWPMRWGFLIFFAWLRGCVVVLQRYRIDRMLDIHIYTSYWFCFSGETKHVYREYMYKGGVMYIYVQLNRDLFQGIASCDHRGWQVQNLICRSGQQAGNSGRSWCCSLESNSAGQEAGNSGRVIMLESWGIFLWETSVFALKTFGWLDEAHPHHGLLSILLSVNWFKH